MSLVSNIVSKENVISELSNLLGSEEDKRVSSLIGMNPNYVKAAIGYAVDFSDYDRTSIAYNSQKEEYDKLYTDINTRMIERQTRRQL